MKALHLALNATLNKKKPYFIVATPSGFLEFVAFPWLDKH